MTPTEELNAFLDSMTEAAEWVAANNDDLSEKERFDLVFFTAREILKRKIENDNIHCK